MPPNIVHPIKYRMAAHNERSSKLKCQWMSLEISTIKGSGGGLKLEAGAGSRIYAAKDEGRTPFPNLPLPGGKVKAAGHIQGIQLPCIFNHQPMFQCMFLVSNQKVTLDAI